MSLKINIPKETIQLIIDDYVINKYNCVEIGKKFAFSRGIIDKTLKENNILIDRFRYTPKYNLNHKFFDDINTSEKSYWLGWLASDGSNNNKSHAIRFLLAEEDKEIIEKFKKSIEYSGPLSLEKRTTSSMGNGKIIKAQDRYGIAFNSFNISNKLKNFGIFTNNTGHFVFPNLRSDLVRHFVRAYFEGDGCISIRKNNRNYINAEINMLASESFLENFIKIIKNIEANGHISNYYKYNNGIKYFRIGGRHNCLKFLEWIYNDCGEFYLSRKREKYLQLKELVNA